MHFSSAPEGCCEIVESSFAFGNHVVNSALQETPILPENWGAACVGPGGYDACDPAGVPIESRTWGNIKTQYR
jgi:hypothetical protein